MSSAFFSVFRYGLVRKDCCGIPFGMGRIVLARGVTGFCFNSDDYMKGRLGVGSGLSCAVTKMVRGCPRGDSFGFRCLVLTAPSPGRIGEGAACM